MVATNHVLDAPPSKRIESTSSLGAVLDDDEA